MSPPKSRLSDAVVKARNPALGAFVGWDAREREFGSWPFAVPGQGPGRPPTITVAGLGHQLWHSFPAVVQLARVMLDPLI